MKIFDKIICINNIDYTATLQKIEEKDRQKLRELYSMWRKLCDGMEEFHSRKINLPEGISENAFCLEFDSARVIDVKGGKRSYDTIDLKNNCRQQIKATSIEYDLTSFGPKSEWDKLYFLDFYRYGNFDHKYDVYEIPNNTIYNSVLNSRKQETFRDQQKQGRRPRLGIKSMIIEPHSINPVRTCSI